MNRDFQDMSECEKYCYANGVRAKDLGEQEEGSHLKRYLFTGHRHALYADTIEEGASKMFSLIATDQISKITP